MAEEHEPHAGVPRLMIREMVLDNFKSYAGQQRVGPFHKCFSSVVGPNGSGKSNVIDAMLFVFGKKAKQLRLSKVSELIHNSTYHQNLDMAQVSVYFQEIVDTDAVDGEGFEVVPGSEFVVARTALRNNTSNYYINGRKSSFKEVTELLKGKGIDLDNNRFLILQGEVEQISLMKPRAVVPNDSGLLEYLEDIIGTDQYVQHIEEQAKRLEELNDARQGMVSRVKVVERDRDALEDDKLLAEGYLGKTTQVHQYRATVAQLCMRGGKENLATIDTSVGQLKEKLDHERAKAEAMSAGLAEAEHKFDAANEDHKAVQDKVEAVTEKFKEYERADVKLSTERKQMKAALKSAATKLQKARDKEQANGQEGEALQQDIPLLEKKVEQLTAQLKQHEEDVERLTEGCRSEVEAHRQDLQAVRQQLAPWEAQAAEVQSRLGVATAERDLLAKNQKDAQDRLQKAETQLEEATQEAGTRQQDVAAMQEELNKCRSAAEQARADEAAAAAEVSRLEGALREVRGKVEQRRAERGSGASQGAVVKALMEAKRAGKVKGVHGRLGDLGAIDPQYDVAASTSVGALDYIVVDSTADAQGAVEFLRRGNLGVATFLILDKQQHLAADMQQRAEPPEGVPRLFDLVRCQDDRLRLAFYYAMRNTVVAGDLDQASRIAFGQDRRWRRVVTLKGDMINESGTMSGGGGRPRTGRMCLGRAAPRATAGDDRQLEQEIAQGEQEMQASQEALQCARQRVRDAGAALRDAEKRAAGLETRIAKAEMEGAAAVQRAADVQQRLEQLRGSTKMSSSDEARIADLGREIEGVQAELAKLQEGAKDLQQQAAALQQRIDSAGGPALAKARKVVKDTDKAMSDAESELQRKRVQAAAGGKAAAKLAKDVAKCEKEIVELEKKLEANKEEKLKMEEVATSVLVSVNEAQALLQEKEGVMLQAKAEYEQQQKEAGIVRSVQGTLEGQLEQLAVNRAREEAALKQHGKELKDQVKKLRELAMEGMDEGDEAEDPEASLLSDEALAEMGSVKDRVDEIKYKIAVLEEELGKMSVNLTSIEAYRSKDREYRSRLADLEDATRQRDEVRRTYDELRKRRLDEFMSGFHTISLKLKEMYQMITLGGDAELELVDSLDPFSEGIVFSVRPPKKSWKNITNLSGGEKTLSSLSLVFALHHYKPTPLYFMDEIDAALDFKNVSIVGHYIKERTRNAQFIIISLRNNMFELADRLVGIYKTDNCTKSVAINPGQFVVGGQQQQRGGGVSANIGCTVTGGDVDGTAATAVAAAREGDENRAAGNIISVA